MHVYLFYFFYYSLLLLTIACSAPTTSALLPYKARVLSAEPPIQASLPLNYSIKTVQLNYLKDVQNLDGDFLQILRGGFFNINKSDSDESAVFYKNQSPNLNYTIEDNTIVPRDYNSFIMLSTYHQFEKIFEALPKITGKSIKEWMDLKDQKFYVHYEPQLKTVAKEHTSYVTLKLNAWYLTGMNRFVLLERGAQERVPLAANLAALAHEFGHAIFEKSFKNNAFSIEEKLSNNDCGIRAINEGFADYFSYRVTGSTDLLRFQTDDYLADQRNFSKVPFNLNDSSIKSCWIGSYYCLGTLFAASLKDTEDALEQHQSDPEQISKEQFSSSIIESIGKIKPILNNMAVKFIPQATGNSEEDCKIQRINKIVGAFAAALILSSPNTLKKPLCHSFKLDSRLGTLSFSKNLQEYAQCEE